jgi:DNA-binding XRE family transcriptional regulator
MEHLKMKQQRRASSIHVEGGTPPEGLHLGRLIALRMDELGMTKAEFGRRIGTSRQNMNSLLRKPLPSAEHIWQASVILHCDFFAAFSGTLHAVEPRCDPPPGFVQGPGAGSRSPSEARLLEAMLRAALSVVEGGRPAP